MRRACRRASCRAPPAAASKGDGAPREDALAAGRRRTRRRRSRVAGAGDQGSHVGEVVEAEQADRGQLLGPREVAEVVAVVAGGRPDRGSPRPAARGRPPSRPCAGRCGSAARGRGRGRRRGGRAGSGRRSRRRRGRGRSRRARSSTSPIPSRCLGASSGSSGAVIASTAAISSLSRPRVPPIAIPSTPASETACADSRRRSSWTPPWTIAEDRLARRALLARASRGSGRASGGCAPSSAPCSRGRRGRACTRRRRGRCRCPAPPAPASRPRAR